MDYNTVTCLKLKAYFCNNNNYNKYFELRFYRKILGLILFKELVCIEYQCSVLIYGTKNAISCFFL